MKDLPSVLFIMSLVLLWLAARAGSYVCHRGGRLDEDDRADLAVVQTAALTLLALIIGFTFSMAVSHYDQRKAHEAVEGNAIGTEFTRAILLPPDDARRMRELLRSYLEKRILFYDTRDRAILQRIDSETMRLQDDLWSAVRLHVDAVPAPIAALVLSGMNDVLNAQAYTQAVWWNRIPPMAWFVMVLIAMCCNALVGFTARRPAGHARRFFLLPLIVSISFLLIADIDSPRGGVIRVHPRNLQNTLRLAPRS